MQSHDPFSKYQPIRAMNTRNEYQLMQSSGPFVEYQPVRAMHMNTRKRISTNARIHKFSCNPQTDSTVSAKPSLATEPVRAHARCCKFLAPVFEHEIHCTIFATCAAAQSSMEFRRSGLLQQDFPARKMSVYNRPRDGFRSHLYSYVVFDKEKLHKGLLCGTGGCPL